LQAAFHVLRRPKGTSKARLQLLLETDNAINVGGL